MDESITLLLRNIQIASIGAALSFVAEVAQSKNSEKVYSPNWKNLRLSVFCAGMYTFATAWLLTLLAPLGWLPEPAPMLISLLGGKWYVLSQLSVFGLLGKIRSAIGRWLDVLSEIHKRRPQQGRASASNATPTMNPV